jgi:hypothetical protein
MKLFIGTPAYNSMVHLDFVESLIAFSRHDIPFTFMGLGNESLITRARNTIVSYFYADKEHTHLLFLDGDIYLAASDLKRLMAREKDIIGAQVALKGTDVFGNPVYNVGATLRKEDDGLFVTDRLGTGVLMLSRKAVEALIAVSDRYVPDVNARGHTRHIDMYDVFKVGVHEHQYLSEDFWVCRRLQELGFEVFVDKTVQTRHSGMFTFS